MDTNVESNLALEEAGAAIGCLSSSVESGVEARLGAIEARLIACEQRLAARLDELKAATAEKDTASVTNTRKTLTAASAPLAKPGLMLDTLDAGALDAALSSLSVEQRIAVKAQLLRAGAINR